MTGHKGIDVVIAILALVVAGVLVLDIIRMYRRGQGD